MIRTKDPNLALQMILKAQYGGMFTSAPQLTGVDYATVIDTDVTNPAIGKGNMKVIVPNVNPNDVWEEIPYFGKNPPAVGSTVIIGYHGQNAQIIALNNIGQNGQEFIYGTTAPTENVGIIGDVYLDTATAYIYGPKTSSGWGTGTPIAGGGGTGVQGPQGYQGYQGSTGIYEGATAPSNTSIIWADTSTTGYPGPQGAQGTQGSQGPQGATPSAPLSLSYSTTATDPLTLSSANGHGGTGYAGLLTMVNSTSGATNPNKFVRLDNSGNLQIINSSYSGTIFQINDAGVQYYGTAAATSNVPTANGINLNSNGYIFDDGNLHVTSTAGAIWINANDGSDVQINKQSPASGGLQVGGKITASNISDSGWTNVSSFSNGFNSAGVAPAYRLLNNVVHLCGNVSGGSANTTAFTLPSGYRPFVTTTIPTQQYGTSNITYVTVNTDGTVVPNASASWLSSITFPIG